jgi:hypothetical protein
MVDPHTIFEAPYKKLKFQNLFLARTKFDREISFCNFQNFEVLKNSVGLEDKVDTGLSNN